MSTYLVQAGDTLESISRARFGTDTGAADIQRSNPGITTPLTAGSTLIIPEQTKARPPISSTPEQLTISISGKSFVGWTEVLFTRSIDTIGSFELRSVWDPNNAAARERFKPMSFQEVSIFEGSTLLFTGTMLLAPPEQDPKSQMVQVSGYSLPGVLNDCTPPIGALPFETDDANLKQVAEELVKPFGIQVQFDIEPGPAFERQAIKPTTKVLPHLISLAQQRQILTNDTPEGAFRFQTEIPAGSPVAILCEGDPGVETITPNFQPQNYYSHITAQTPAEFKLFDDDVGSTFTVPNTRLTDVLRPFTFSPPDTNTGDVKVAAEAKMGRMFASAISYSMVVPDWVNPASGLLWEPNTTIKIHKPGAMIYSPYEFLIKSVTYRRGANTKTATLDLVLPGSFRGEIPEVLPWDG